MKKFIGIAVSAVFAVGTVFAMGEYHGDVQAHIGVGFDSVTASVSQEVYKQKIEAKQKFGSVLFEIDIASWHLFDLNDLFSVGFAANLNGGFGGTTKCSTQIKGAGQDYSTDMSKEYFKGAAHFTGLLGPAIGINAGNIVHANLGLGLAFGCTGFTFSYVDENKIDITTGGVGFGADLQAKILPKNKINPVIGYRFSVIPSKKITSVSKETKDKETQDFDSVTYICNQIYVGAAYNF